MWIQLQTNEYCYKIYNCNKYIVYGSAQIAVPLSRNVANDNKMMRLMFFLTDMLLILHFTLDPYLYVLHHWELIKMIVLRTGQRDIQRNSSSATVSRTSSMRTSSCDYAAAPSTQPQPVWRRLHARVLIMLCDVRAVCACDAVCTNTCAACGRVCVMSPHHRVLGACLRTINVTTIAPSSALVNDNLLL